MTIAFAFSLLLAADLRFAIIGDNTGRAKPGVYERVWREVDALRPAFAIAIGDVIEGGKDETMQGQWDSFAPLFGSLGKYPRLFVAGNHDIWSAKSRAAFEKFTGRPVSYGFDLDGIHITVADNSTTENLSAEQLRFVERDLAANQDKRLRFVFFHKPFWLVPLKLRNLNHPFHQLMKKYQVHSVFSGHVHQMHRIEREGVVYWCVPSSGGDLRGNDSFEKGWFYGYLIADVPASGKPPVFAIHELGGGTLPAESWGENGPGRVSK